MTRSGPRAPSRRYVPALVAVLAVLPGCRNDDRFTTAPGERFEGSITPATFARAGFSDSTRLCLTLDADHLQDAPGTLTTSDGQFRLTPLQPIPELWRDPLSMLSFGEGRERNLIYVATPIAPLGDSGSLESAFCVVSLLSSGDVEVRLMRQAPSGPSSSPQLFGVFSLTRRTGPCSF